MTMIATQASSRYSQRRGCLTCQKRRTLKMIAARATRSRATMMPKRCPLTIPSRGSTKGSRIYCTRQRSPANRSVAVKSRSAGRAASACVSFTIFIGMELGMGRGWARPHPSPPHHNAASGRGRQICIAVPTPTVLSAQIIPLFCRTIP
jgi:hypothetical protein